MYSLTPPFYAASGGEYNPKGFKALRIWGFQTFTGSSLLTKCQKWFAKAK